MNEIISNLGFVIIFLMVLYSPFIIYFTIINKRREKLQKRNLYDENNKDEKFENIYSNLNVNNVYKLEKIRKDIKKTKIYKIILLLLIIAFVIIAAIKNEHAGWVYILVRIIPFFVIYICIKDKKENDYIKLYRKSMVPDFVKLYNENLVCMEEIDCEGEKYIKQNFVDLKLPTFRLIEHNDYYLKVQNFIYVQLDDETIMSLYDIEAKDNNKLPLFEQTYILMDIGRQIPTYIRISMNKLITRNNKVELDSIQFEKNFDVYSEDNILATRILTSDVMQMLVDFYKKYNINFEITLVANNIHINMETATTFKIPIYKNIKNKSILYLYYVILEFTTNLSKEINKALNGIEL